MPYTRTKTDDSATGGVSYSWSNTRRVWSPTYGWTVTSFPQTATALKAPNRKWKKRDWNVTPGYKALLATNGFLQTLEYSLAAWEQSRVFTPCTWKHASLPEWWDEPCHYATFSRPSTVSNNGWVTPTEITSHRTNSQHKTLAKARDMKVNLPVMFGEGRKTINMLTDTASRLGNAYLSFLKKDFRRAARYLGIDEPKGFASHWLAYQYGWRPLLSDAAGLTDLLSEMVDKSQARPPRFTVTAKSELVRALKWSEGYGFSAYGTGSVDYKGEVCLKARSGLTLEMMYQSSALAARLGVGTTDLLLTAWELVPFSFVFDWFVNVGQWLESASALSGYRVLCGFTGHEIKSRDLKVTARETSGGTYRLESGQLMTGTMYERIYYRSSWMGSQPTVYIRGLDGLLSSATRLKSAAALFVQLCSGDRRKGAYSP